MIPIFIDFGSTMFTFGGEPDLISCMSYLAVNRANLNDQASVYNPVISPLWFTSSFFALPEIRQLWPFAILVSALAMIPGSLRRTLWG